MRSTSGTWSLISLASLFLMAPPAFSADKPKASQAGSTVPHVVFVTGDEEYRSEESMPMLAKILHRDFGFEVTVCYSLAKDGTIDPNNLKNIAGLEAVDSADLLVIVRPVSQAAG